MTDRHSAILPIMISALIGQSVSKLISERSFYEYVAKRINDSMPQDS
jgi:H+/Cl- antiporter ClcA